MNCHCAVGFMSLIYYLSDVNECSVELHDCSATATCTNTEGSFLCYCNPGYSGNGTYCIGMFFVDSFSECYENH